MSQFTRGNLTDLVSILELRDQLRQARLEEDKTLTHLQKVKERNEQLEAELNLYHEEGICLESQVLHYPCHLAFVS